MSNSVAVVIPYYHSELTELEQVSYRQCIKKLRKHPIVLVVPESMREEDYPTDDNLIFESVPTEWMESVATYNQMMVNFEFYNRFTKYEYILIYQLDAFVFQDRLLEFCDYNYDYMGAPWLDGVKTSQDSESKVYYVGNGGFSLRKVETFCKALSKKKELHIDIPEDVYWASRELEGFSVAPKEVALKFAFEMQVKKCFELNSEKLPFGCHAWEKFDYAFWEPYLQQEGYIITTQIKGDLDLRAERARNRPERAMLQINKDVVLKYCNQYFNWEKKNIYIWGAGVRGEKTGKILRNIGIQAFSYIDVDISKAGKELCEAKILTPELAIKEEKDILIIITVKGLEDEILAFLQEKGYRYGCDVFYYQEWMDGLLNLPLKGA